MPRHLKFTEAAIQTVRSGANELGARIRVARKRRQLTLREAAARAGIAYDTARAVERGNPMTGVGAYLALIWVLGLEGELRSLLHPDNDEEGKKRALNRATNRVTTLARTGTSTTRSALAWAWMFMGAA
jgi:transcriptional regulator with XRE-family HTH domain